MGKKKDIPYLKIGLTAVAVTGGIAILYNTGILKKKTKKVLCNKLLLSDGFSPDVFASEIYGDLAGLSLAGGEGSTTYRKIIVASDNDLKCLHNSWTKLIDDKESVYTFLEGQKPYPFSTESQLQKKALQRLSQAGIKEK